MKKKIVAIAGAVIVALSLTKGYSIAYERGYSRGLSEPNDEITAVMYEDSQDERDQEATKSGNADAFMAGFDYAVQRADALLSNSTDAGRN